MKGSQSQKGDVSGFCYVELNGRFRREYTFELDALEIVRMVKILIERSILCSGLSFSRMFTKAYRSCCSAKEREGLSRAAVEFRRASQESVLLIFNLPDSGSVAFVSLHSLFDAVVTKV